MRRWRGVAWLGPVLLLSMTARSRSQDRKVAVSDMKVLLHKDVTK